MGYAEFRRDYDRVMELCLTAKLDLDGLAGSIERLSDVRDRLAPGPDRDRATGDIDDMYEILTLARQTPYANSPAFVEASRVLSRATIETGSVQERIDRARRGIEEIHAIARTIRDSEEREGVQQMVEPLSLLISSLSDSRSAPPRPGGSPPVRPAAAAPADGLLDGAERLSPPRPPGG
jgi:hypothetical protein